MAQEFAGNWNFESSDNFDEYLKAVGVGLITRKVAANLKPQIVIKVDGDHWRLESNSTFKNIVVEFDLGKEFEETTGDGRKVMSTFTLENGKLHQVQKATKSGEKDSTFDRYLEGGKLVIDMEADGVKAKRVYTRAA
uniref:Cytosolic fatty-acid binding proteins domain-containing protein n=1 Tax=Panagrolaimus superbus TaxID=310955 RepID=A0A914Y6P9_9BILA